MVGCPRSPYPSIHLSFHCADTLKITVGCLVCGVCCVVFFACACGACGVCGVCLVCVWCVWCVVCVCGVCCVGACVCGVWWSLARSLSCSLFLSPLYLSFAFSFPFFFSIIFIFLFPLLLLLLFLFLFLFIFLFLFLFLTTKHCVKNRSTNKFRGVRMWPGTRQLHSISVSLHRTKRRGTFLLQEYFRRGNYFTLQFYINSEKSPPGEITVIAVLY